MPCRLYLVNCLAIYSSYLIPRFYPLQFATLLRVAWLTAGFLVRRIATYLSWLAVARERAAATGAAAFDPQNSVLGLAPLLELIWTHPIKGI